MLRKGRRKSEEGHGGRMKGEGREGKGREGGGVGREGKGARIEAQ